MLSAGSKVDGRRKADRTETCDTGGFDSGETIPSLPTLSSTDVALHTHGRWPLMFPSSAAISFLAHASILVWLLIEAPSQPGLAGQELDAIGVEIVDAGALESTSSKRTPDTSGGVARVVTDDTGTEAPVTLQRVTAASPAPEPAETVPPPAAPLKAVPETEPEIAAAEIVRDNPDRPPIEEPRTEPPTEPVLITVPESDEGRDKLRQAEQQAAVAGGAASRAAEAATASAAVASASPGQLTRFAMQVRTSLGQSRPRHLGSRGRVLVAFVLSDVGALLSAQIAKSSANPRLDEAALQAVRATPFPRPPAGTSQAERSFVVPFDFQ